MSSPAPQSHVVGEVPGLSEAIQSASPTGAPRVKPTQVPWLLGVMVGAVAGLEVCASSVPDETTQLACRIGAVVLAGVLGTVSPGWRRSGHHSPPVQ